MAEHPLPVVSVKSRRALPFFSRHPWVFTGTLSREGKGLQPGQEVALTSHEGEFIAYGLYNPHSKIRVRLYSWNRDERLDDEFWRRKVCAALTLRRKLFAGSPAWNACRLIFSEADGLSGLTVDRYGDYLALQWTSAALALRAEPILSQLCEELSPRGAWLRTERGMGEAEGLTLRDGPLRGEMPPRPLFIQENGLSFGVDMVEGHKTGYYFDQRDNRAAAARYCRGARVLDLFCYTGSFGIAAARLGEAASVLCVDSSSSALDLARENAKLNEVHDRVRFAEEEAFRKLEDLKGVGDRFDVVILDPPKMARSRGGLDRALRGYQALNRMAMEVLNPGGILVTCSCSGLVDRLMFQEMLAKAALEANCVLQILESRGAAADHPVNIHCPDNAYLKCFICCVTPG